MRKLVFEEAAIPEVIAEPALPIDFMRGRWLQFSEFSDWNDVARWADTLFSVNASESPEFSQLVGELTSLKSDEERVAKALEVVQSDIRYFSIALGENSHRPAQPGEVLKRRYGDCKDKAFLLTALLRAVSIDSRPMLLSVRRKSGLNKSLPSPLTFDHAIVRVRLANRAYFLDATRQGQHGRIDRMGQPYEGAEGLVVAGDTAGLTTIETPNILDLMRSELSETAYVSEMGGDGEVQSRSIANGQDAEALRVLFQQVSRDRLQALYTEVVAKNYPGAKLLGDIAINDDRLNNIVTVTTRATVPKLTKEEKQMWYLRFSPSNLAGAIAPLPTSGRTTPMAMPYFPYEGKYTFNVEFPASVRVPRDSLKHSVKNSNFTYDASILYNGSSTTTNITLKTIAAVVQPKDFKKYSDDVTALGHAISALVPVPKRFVRPGKVAAKEDPANRLRRQIADNAAAQTRLINSRTLTGVKLASAYCDRSTYNLYLDKLKQVFADLDKAYKLAPADGAIAVCRADANFHIGAFDKSAEDYSRAITLDAKDSWTFQGRGLTKFYSGNYESAVTDLTKASELADASRRTYVDLWLASSYRRLKKELPDDLKARSAADPRGEWPKPVLAAVAGVLKADDLIAILESKTGEDKLLASTEAFFFLGQLYLDQGDRAAAEEYFKKARATNALMYIEFVTAKFELDALAGGNQIVTGAVAAPKPTSGSAAAPTSAAAPSPTGISAPEQSPTAPPPVRKKKPATNPDWNTNALQLPLEP